MASNHNNHRFRAIIFDMDGLLVDSERVWYAVETEMIESKGFVYGADVRSAVIGLRVDEFIEKLHAHYVFKETVTELTDELIQRVLAVIPTQVKSQPGAHELIAWVQQQKIAHAIASSSPMSIIDATLDSQGWGDWFAVRCTADDEARGKPAPDVYLAAARQLGVDPHDCVALEDSPNGARAAVAAGMTCYAVPDKSHSRPEAFNDITLHVFDSLHNVLASLKAI